MVERRLFLIAGLVLIFAWVLPAGMGLAAPGDAYKVGGVDVDTTAESAAAARDNAILEGQREAYRRLLQRLVGEGAVDQVPPIDDATLSGLVKDFAVEEERSSSIRYIARLSFGFDRDAVRQLLLDAGVPFTEERSQPIVVLPVWSGEAAPVLWEDPNPWREAFAREERGDGLVPFLVPIGDVEDLTTINADQALDADAVALDAIVGRYQGAEVLVAEALPEGDQIVVVTRRFQDGILLGTDQVRAPDLARAVDAVTQPIESGWKAQNLVGGGGQETLLLSVPLASLKDWIEIRRRLESVSSLRRMTVRSLSRSEASVEITYSGDQRQLQFALAQRELTLAPEPIQGGWILQRRGAGP
ncbi:MAG TPA: DUF2066 domain-containing protein [Alphaproteobacteria bacterium]|nr:DUF2066 domain-containing protein [Alphaproteobacteria bacterium]